LRASTDDNRFGYTIGGGLEAKLTEHIRVKAEYLYVDLGEAEYNVGLLGGLVDHSGSTQIDLHLIRAGLAYQF
jgi:outer membrane immunogenic protein